MPWKSLALVCLVLALAALFAAKPWTALGLAIAANRAARWSED